MHWKPFAVISYQLQFNKAEDIIQLNETQKNEARIQTEGHIFGSRLFDLLGNINIDA